MAFHKLSRIVESMQGKLKLFSRFGLIVSVFSLCGVQARFDLIVPVLFYFIHVHTHEIVAVIRSSKPVIYFVSLF